MAHGSVSCKNSNNYSDYIAYLYTKTEKLG